MAWSVLQSASSGNSGGTGNPTATFGSNLSAGTKLIAWVAGAKSGTLPPTAVTDSNSNAFTLIAHEQDPSNLVVAQIWVLDTPAGDIGTKPTITVTSNTNFVSFVVQEVSGLAAGGSGSLDGTPGTSTGTTNGSTAAPAYSSTAHNEYLVTFYVDSYNAQGWSTSPPGYTLDANAVNFGQSAFVTAGVAYKNSTGSSESATWTTGGGTPTWCQVFAAFKLPSVPLPENPVPPQIPHPLWPELLEVAAQRADWQAQGVASPVAQHWRLMDGIAGRPGTGSTGTQPPSTATGSGNNVMGTSFYVTQGGMFFEGYWWYVASGQSTASQKFALWSVTSSAAGSVVPGSAVTSGALAAGWNWVPLAKPVPLAIWGYYTAQTAVSGAYPDTVNQFGPGNPYAGGITSGPLAAFSDETGSNPPPYSYGQGVITSGTDPAAVLATGTPAAHDNFWLDVQVTNAPAGYTGSYRLWPNMTDAYGSAADAAVNYVLGTEFILSQACVVTAAWYYFPGGGSTQFATSADIWRVRDGVRVATQPAPVWTGASGAPAVLTGSGQWLRCELPGVTLPAGDYRVSVYNGNASPDQWSAKRLGYWQAYNQAPDGTYQHNPPGASGITSGPLYAPTTPAASPAADFNAPSVTEPGQSVFATGPPNQFPNVYVGTPANLFQNYWIDVEVIPASVFQPDAPVLPQRVPRPQWERLLAVAQERLLPGSNTPSVSSAVTGGAAGLTFTAPAGTVSASSAVTGIATGLTLAVPAGTVAADGTASGVTAAITLTATAGTATAGSSVTGTPAQLTLAAPAGAVAAGDGAAGVTAALTLAAPAGTISASSSISGTVAALTLGAPGGAAVEGSVVSGIPAPVTLTAPAGTVTASSAVTGQPAQLTLTATPGTASGPGHSTTNALLAVFFP